MEGRTVEAGTHSKIIGISVGAVCGCVAAAGLAGMFIYRHRQKKQEEEAVPDELNTRYRTQSFMAVVAGAVAKLPKRDSARSSLGVLGTLKRAASVKPSLVTRRSSSPNLAGSPTIQYNKALFLTATQQIELRIHAHTLTDSTEAPLIPQAPLDSIASTLQQQEAFDGSLDQLRRLQTMSVFSILQFHPMMIAYQLTLIDSAIFRQITPEALKDHTPKDPEQSIVASTDFFNYLTRLIEHSILIKLEAADRSQHINYWIKVAHRCHELRNYQTLKAVISALGTPPLQRLRLSWSFVPKKSIHLLEDMTELMSETANYEKYRQHVLQIPKVTEPTVPFLGTFLHDMTYLNALNKPEDERIKELRSLFFDLQQTPAYTAELPLLFLKEVSAYHRPRFSIRSSVSKRSRQEEELIRMPIDLQQCLVSNYLLTRPWVNEKAVDELSVLREPTKSVMTSSVSLTPTRSSTSSLTSSSTGPSRPLSLEDEEDYFDKKMVPGFRLFGRKSTDRATEPAGTLQRSPRYFSLDEIHKTEEDDPKKREAQLPPIFRKEFWKNTQSHRFSIVSYNSDPVLSTTHQTTSPHPLDPESFIWTQ
ncbi:ras guanine nucleotide exchange factor domain-containing protein [Sporodiniella umbellata]|nr:ras guanine nucleotide exchange factor domain-containing protein [Sporodiniella umbellata]